MDVYQRRRLVALSALAAFFIVIVLLIRSCGGSEETPSALTAPVSGASGATGAALTKDAYISQGDDICLSANSSLADVDESDAEQAATDKAKILSGELQQLQTLSPPEEDSGTLNDFLSALSKEVKAYDDQATAAQRGDDATVAELDTTISKFADKAQAAAKEYGFETCGNTSKVSQSGDTTSTDTTGTTPTTDTGTDSGGTVTPATPTTTTPVAPAPTDQGGTAAPTPAPTPAPAPSDGGTGSSGGVTP